MNILSSIRGLFLQALADFVSEPAKYLEMVRQSQNSQFGDYQANLAMPLAKSLGRSPQEIAAEIVGKLDVYGVLEAPEVAGPGFINLRLNDPWLAQQLRIASRDVDRLSVPKAESPRTLIIDYSSPNVAKSMHVGHIRSTVIGHALYRTLKFLGHQVIGDNHIGDWGTQFGMIIYGFKHFRNAANYEANAVAELGRLYRLVSQLVEYHDSCKRYAEIVSHAEECQAALDAFAALSAPEPGDKSAKNTHASKTRDLEANLHQAESELVAIEEKVRRVNDDPELSTLAAEHPEIGVEVLKETALLHEGDAENQRLWNEFLPPCLEDIDRIYRRLNVTFDCSLGESFYHDQLAGVVDTLVERGMAREENGAICVFSDEWPAPMIIRKQDGAFLYATTDLATVKYRVEKWDPDAILYVVDHRQSLHFEQLFGASRKWGYDNLELQHVSFGTVLGDDGKPFKTRSGATVGLEGLLDEAVERAHQVVRRKDDEKPNGPELSADVRAQIAEVVGIGSLKYADLSHNRSSDYAFSYDKMLSLDGNTAAYMQYAYVRVQSIFRKGEIDVELLRNGDAAVHLQLAEERALALKLLQFSEALEAVVEDYRPNQLTAYLFSLANQFAVFLEKCPVLKAETEAAKNSRLLLCDLTARTIKKGLELLGIGTVEYM